MIKRNYYKPLQADIKALLKLRESDELLSYFTSDRQPNVLVGSQIHIDTVPFFYKALRAVGKQKKISLLLYSQGGMLDAP